jgi:hypothetical protein
MLFLLGNKVHPVVRILIAAAMIAIGLIVGLQITTILGVLGLVWTGYTWFRRSRAEARREEAGRYQSGAVR